MGKAKQKSTIVVKKVSFNLPQKLVDELYILYEKDIVNHAYHNFTFSDYIRDLLINVVQKDGTK
jgi:hypothetical protein